MNIIINTAITTAIGVLGSLMLIILILSLVLNKEWNNKLGRIFFILLVAMLGYLIIDTVAWVFDYGQKPLARTICVIANFIAFLLAGAVLLIYSIYIYACVSAKTRASKTTVYIVCVLTALYQIAVVISLFNGMLYYITPDNEYVHGPYYVCTLIYMTAVWILNGCMILYHYKYLGMKDTVVLLSYVYLPMFALFAHFLFPHWMFLHVAFLLALLIIYVNYQTKQGERLRMELMNSRTSIILSQIKPHFLYNSLSAIENLCVENPIQAQQTVHDFAKYLRGNLNSLSRKELIPFEKEMEHTRHYLSLEKQRFQEKLQVEYQLLATGFMIPALTVQPIAENAVRHGISKREGKGTLVIDSYETEKEWCIKVSDNGIGFDPQNIQDDKIHSGIENVRTRLSLLCQGTLDIKSEPGKGTIVTMVIPKKRG